MDAILTQNYQTNFKMKQSLKKYAIIQQKAKNTYQHLSPFILQQKEGANSVPIINKLADRLRFLRRQFESSDDSLKVLIEHLKISKLGNAGEEAMLATAIGKMNGQKNIYTGRIKGLDHAVSFITDKVIKNNKELLLKDKNAIVIDPQLGITDYVGNYFSKLQDRLNNRIRVNDRRIIPVHNTRINNAQMADLKASYPELLIENYEKL